jgi:hypothetical protein
MWFCKLVSEQNLLKIVPQILVSYLEQLSFSVHLRVRDYK